MDGMLEAALGYAELGYRVFPCAAEANPVPLTRHGFKDATGDRDQIERWWTRHPDACIGLAADGLLVVDIDAPPNPWLADQPDLAMDLIAAPTSITPGGGRHHIFRRPAGRTWACTVGQLAPHVDTRTDGGYIVVPPSARPDGSYRWLEGCELDVGPDQLPEPPAWLVEQLDRLATSSPTLPKVASSTPGTNQIPSGQRNATLARLAGAMRRVGMSQSEIGAALQRANADRCVPPLPALEVDRIAASIARYEPDQVAVAMAENHWEQMYLEESEVPNENRDPGPIPDRLLHVPGFVGEVIDYTLSTAPYPEPVLAFGAALSLQSFLAGRKVRDESDNRTNLYVLGLANSGAGKDYPRKVNQRILLQVGMSDCIGDTFASGEGIEDRLFTNPTALFQTDEIDGLMTKINQAKDARHDGIMNVLLKMYTSSNSVYPMRVKAGKEHGVIDQPSLCIFGTAIPKHYYDALSLKMLTNGFFARMLILETLRARAPGKTPWSATCPIRSWKSPAGGRNSSRVAAISSTGIPVPIVVQQTPDAPIYPAAVASPRGRAIRGRRRTRRRDGHGDLGAGQREGQASGARLRLQRGPRTSGDRRSGRRAGRGNSSTTKRGGCCSWPATTSARTNSTPAARRSSPRCGDGGRSTATLGCHSGRSTVGIRGASASTRRCGRHC